MERFSYDLILVLATALLVLIACFWVVIKNGFGGPRNYPSAYPPVYFPRDGDSSILPYLIVAGLAILGFMWWQNGAVIPLLPSLTPSPAAPIAPVTTVTPDITKRPPAFATPTPIPSTGPKLSDPQMQELANLWEDAAFPARKRVLFELNPAPFDPFLHPDARDALRGHLQTLARAGCRWDIASTHSTTLGFIPISDVEFIWNVQLTEDLRKVCAGDTETVSTKTHHVQMRIRLIHWNNQWVAAQPFTVPHLLGDLH